MQSGRGNPGRETLDLVPIPMEHVYMLNDNERASSLQLLSKMREALLFRWR
jgi:hypothetical protein